MTETNISWLKPEQVEAMRDAAYQGRHGSRDDAIVTVLYDTGLRRLELSRVDRDMLDLDDSVLRLPGGSRNSTPTTAARSPGRSRSIPTASSVPSGRFGRGSTTAAPSRRSSRRKSPTA